MFHYLMFQLLMLTTGDRCNFMSVFNVIKCLPSHLFITDSAAFTCILKSELFRQVFDD